MWLKSETILTCDPKPLSTTLREDLHTYTHLCGW